LSAARKLSGGSRAGRPRSNDDAIAIQQCRFTNQYWVASSSTDYAA
jgi:hypothetical protein